MKKKVISLTLAAMMALGAVPAYASDEMNENVVWSGNLNTETGELTVNVDNTTPVPTYTALPNNEIRVVVNQKELTVRGVSIDGRTLVPLRALGEALGASVNWDADKQEIRIEKMLYQSDSKGIVTESNRVILMNIGSKQILKNGTAQELDVAPQIINGSTMVPVRAVTDFLEATIDWDETSRTVKVQPSMATSVGGAMVEKQNQHIDFGNAVANRVEEINRQAEIEKEQYKAENRPKGEMKAWGYSVYSFFVDEMRQMTDTRMWPGWGLNFSIRDEDMGKDSTKPDIDEQKFKIAVIEKSTGQTVYSTTFIYGDLEEIYRDTKNLQIPNQYLDEEKYEYSFSVVIE